MYYFLSQIEKIDNNDNNDKYNNNRYNISSETVNFEKTETSGDEYRE